MTHLTFHSKPDEIGGNKILLESNKTNLWLDFGMSFKTSGMFYDDFMNPRKINGVGDYIEMGLIPKEDGLYREDLAKRSGLKESPTKFDAVLLSHPHVDHFGHFDLLNENIPLFMGETAKLIISAIDESCSGEFLSYRKAFTGLHYTKNPKIERKIKTFRTGDVFSINNLKITPHHVDHSIPGAYGYIIETPDGNIVYTGDIRMHGNKSQMTKEFIKKASSYDPAALIIEGTRVGDSKEKNPMRKMGMTEEQVYNKISEIVSSTKELVVANFPARDIDRFNTFYKAAKNSGRNLIIDIKQAYLLKMLESDKNLEVPKYTDKNIQIYAKRCGNGLITEDIPISQKEKDYFVWQREFIDLDNTVTFKDIDQKKSVFYCNSFSFGEIIDIKPKTGSSYIYSLCEPFNTEMELDMERFMNWINHFKLKFHHAHASGHASKEEIKEAVETINAKKVIPVHTEHPEIFKEFSKNVLFPKKGEKITLTP